MKRLFISILLLFSISSILIAQNEIKEDTSKKDIKPEQLYNKTYSDSTAISIIELQKKQNLYFKYLRGLHLYELPSSIYKSIGTYKLSSFPKEFGTQEGIRFRDFPDPYFHLNEIRAYRDLNNAYLLDYTYEYYNPGNNTWGEFLILILIDAFAPSVINY